MKFFIPLSIVFIASCGNWEKDKYEAGNYQIPSGEAQAQPQPRKRNRTTPPTTDGKDQGSKTPAGKGMTGTGEMPKPSMNIEVDGDFNTGTTQCVANQMGNKRFQPLKLGRNLKDFSTQEVKTLEDWEDLVDLILRTVVNTDGLVNYSSLRGEFRTQLDRAVAAMENPSIVSAPIGTDYLEAIAFWTNAYNLRMIDIVTDNPTAKNVGQDLGFSIFDKKFKFAGFDLSLNQIEKGILKLGGGSSPAPESLIVEKFEPRLHFTLVCGALGCPKLRNFFYRPDAVEAIMEENTLEVVNSKKFFEPVAEDGIIYLSDLIFSFYPDDFETLFGANFIKAAEMMLPTCRNDIEDAKAFLQAGDTDSITYDWTINAQK